MNLKIINIIDPGVPKKERLHISVLVDTNLTYFAVFDTSYVSGDSIAAGLTRAYWFSDYPIKAGDHVILYTKDGEPSVRQRNDGHRNHFFYWGLNRPVWGDPNSGAVVLQIQDWETSPPL